jgi:aspartate kinase
MSVVVSSKELQEKRADVMADICKAVNPENIFVEENLALIAVVGRGMVKVKGTAARVFDAVSAADVNIKMIDQGSSEVNIILAVEEHDFETAVKAIYKEFASK